MANRIKGITVEIGGDTTGLDKALKSVNSSIKTTQSSLKDVNRLLKLDPKNTELLSQKQKLLKDAIGATKEKLDSLKPCSARSSKPNRSCSACSRKRKRQTPPSPRSMRSARRWRPSETASPVPVRK